MSYTLFNPSKIIFFNQKYTSMKNLFTRLGFLVAFVIYLFLLSNSSGAPAQTTGAPGEATCGRSSCHNVTENQGSATISLNFGEGATAYVPGETYTVKIAIEGAQNESKNGFQIVALDAQDANIGAWNITDANAMQMRSGGGREYITHDSGGNSQTSWEVNWVAPAEDGGNVTFYLAVNDANDNGGRTGDAIYITKTTIEPSNSTNIAEVIAQSVQIYPNPAFDYITVESPNYAIHTYRLFNINGQQVAVAPFKNTIPLFDLSVGMYFLQLEGTEGIAVKKVSIVR